MKKLCTFEPFFNKKTYIKYFFNEILMTKMLETHQNDYNVGSQKTEVGSKTKKFDSSRLFRILTH